LQQLEWPDPDPEMRVYARNHCYTALIRFENLPVRRLLFIFLLLMLPLHSVAVQGNWWASGTAIDVAHEIEHAKGTSHHHGDDGSLQYDDSSASTQHCLEYCAAHQGASLPSGAMPQLMLAALSIASGEFTRYIPDPIPERPARPPLPLL
jgi:hypothetical protein